MHSFNKNKGSVSHQHISLTNSDVYSNPPFYLRGDGSSRNGGHVADFEEIQHSAGNGFHYVDTHLISSTSSTYNNNGSTYNINGMMIKENDNNIVPVHEIASSSGVGSDGIGQLLLQYESANVHFENWESDSDHVVALHHTYNKHTDTDAAVSESRSCEEEPNEEKGAYVQQLENNRQRLTQLEHDLERTRQQGIFVRSGFSRDHSRRYTFGNGSTAFDIDYKRWLDEHQRLINDLRSAVYFNLGDNELSLILERLTSHYDGIFRLKGSFAKSNIFHILSGMWKSPAERFLMWLGGFRSSDFIKVISNQIEPLTEEQFMGICNLQQSSQQAEDALSQGVEALQQSIVETISSNSICDNYVGQMAIAMSKLATLENFLRQADLLRLQTLQQLQQILTPRQAARALLAINDYKSRLQALSSLWLARPNE